MDEINDDKVREVINDISSFKNGSTSREEFKAKIDNKIFFECFDKYEEYKLQNSLMDFDDLQLQAVELFKK